MKTKIYEFTPVIYPFPLRVCKYVQGVTAKELADTYNKVSDRWSALVSTEEDFLAYPTLTAKTVCAVEKDTEKMCYLVILYRPKKIRYGIVAHESLHVLTLLGDWLGFNSPNASDDEPHAYFIEWVANCIGSVIDGHPESMNGKLL